jgi:hypothetical protein
MNADFVHNTLDVEHLSDLRQDVYALDDGLTFRAILIFLGYD